MTTSEVAPDPPPRQRLATLVAVDVAGWSALNQQDQQRAARLVGALRERANAAAEEGGGRVFNTAGDGLMLEFPSATAAFAAAAALVDEPPAELALRIGVHLGEVVVGPGADLLGHGVNVAARLEAAAPVGGALISAAVRDQLQGPALQRLTARRRLSLPGIAGEVEAWMLNSSRTTVVASPRDGLGWTRRNMAIALTGGAASVAGIAAAGWWALRREGAVETPVVAVLPFDDLGGDSRYLADGLSEEILNVLTRERGVRVAARSSSFEFRGARKADAARALGATHILDGSVAQAGGRVRVSAHLSDARQNLTIWSQSYDRDLSQALVMEQDIAAQVATALRVTLAIGGPAAEAIDRVAYDLYLRGVAAFHEERPASVEQAIVLLRGAAQRAPGFSRAHSALALALLNACIFRSPDQQTAMLADARREAEAALRLDPANGAAYGALGRASPTFGRWSEVSRTFRRGLEVEPNNPTLGIYWGRFLLDCGRLNEASRVLARAADGDPLSWVANNMATMAAAYAARVDEADARLHRLQAVWPDRETLIWVQTWVDVASGRFAEAARRLEQRAARAGADEQLHVFASVYRVLAGGGDAAPAAAALRRLALRGVGYASAAIPMLAAMGRLDDCFEIARSIYLGEGAPIPRREFVDGPWRLNNESATLYLLLPLGAALRRDRRFPPLAERLGLTDLWREQPPDFCERETVSVCPS